LGIIIRYSRQDWENANVNFRKLEMKYEYRCSGIICGGDLFMLDGGGDYLMLKSSGVNFMLNSGGANLILNSSRD